MGKLQNNFTTPEQSKKLLELGVPVDSADCLLDTEWLKIDEDDVPSVIHKTHKFTDYNQQDYTPCWSVGRLIEIAKICSKSRYALRGLFLFLEECEDCLLQLIDYFENIIYDIDFSKLEE